MAKLQDVITLCLLLLIHVAHSQECDPNFTILYFRLHGLILDTVYTPTSQSCMSKCSSNSACRSINYYQHEDKCELNKGSHLTHPEALLPNDGVVYVQNSLNQIKDRYCSDKFCSEPLVCVVTENDYDCVTCEASSRKEVLEFPRKSVQDKVEWEHPFDNYLNAFTVSLWVQTDPATSFHSVFSYAVYGNANELCIHLSSTYTRLIVKNTIKDNSGVTLNDGNWHHIAWTWQSTDGKWNLYINGIKRIDGTIHAGRTIPKGAIILGQDADSYIGGYDASQSLQGKLTMVNMWDKVLSAAEISAIHTNKCTSASGNLIQWNELVKKRSGQVKLTCPTSFCT